MAKAQSVEDVVLGEAKAGNYADMVAIASVIENRSRQLGVTYEQVVQNQDEFNAYNKALPPGVNQFRDMARKAIEQVQTQGPVHRATFYATPSATKGLPKGLSYVTETAGHKFFEDPQNRAIGTAIGYVRPSAEPLNVAGQPANTLYDVANPPTPEARPDPNAAARASLAEPSAQRGLAGLSPSFQPGSQGTIASFDRTGITAPTNNMLDALGRAGFGTLGVNSGFRSPSRNASAGGARRSQHMSGRAVDLATKDLSNIDKSRVLDAALSAGAKGIGLYNSGVMHLDTRAQPGFWGPNAKNPYAGVSIDEMPSWSRNDLQALVDARGANYLPSGVINNVPTPEARPNPNAPVGRAMLGGPPATITGAMAMPTQGPSFGQPPAPPAVDMAAMASQYGQYRSPTPPTVEQQINAMTPAISMPSALPSFAPAPASVPAAPPAAVPMPAPRPAPAPVAPPAPVQQQVAAPQVSRPTPTVAPPAPSFTGQDVWSGRAQSGIATNGNQMTRNPDGTVSMTSSRYGYTETMNPDGSFRSTNAPGLLGIDAMANSLLGGIPGPLGRQPSQQGIQPQSPQAQPGRSRLGQGVRSVGGSVAGGMIGGLLGPFGGLVGSYLVSQMAQGKNPLGGILGNTTPQQSFQRGFTPGLAFPDRPTAPSNPGSGQLTDFGERAPRGESGGRDRQGGRASSGEISGLF